MENIKVLICEDQRYLQNMIRMFLVEMGLHEVVGQAHSVDEARELIGQLEVGDFQVALVDGNYSPDRIDSAEGTEIIRMLRAKFGKEVKIVGISSATPMEDADENISKNGMEIVETIKKL
jgi:response regulator of citrate/malate metabolism